MQTKVKQTKAHLGHLTRIESTCAYMLCPGALKKGVSFPTHSRTNNQCVEEEER